MGIVVLASASRRRRSWLSEALDGLDVDLRFCDIGDSEPKPRVGEEVKLQSDEACMHKARKAVDSLGKNGGGARIIIVSDTLVEDPDDHLAALGKPSDLGSAASTLIRLSGRRHVVWSSTAILEVGTGNIELEGGWRASLWTDHSIVEFEEIQEEAMEEMLKSGSWVGKAGGYDIAGMGGRFARVIEGEEVTVLGFSHSAIDDLVSRLS